MHSNVAFTSSQMGVPSRKSGQTRELGLAPMWGNINPRYDDPICPTGCKVPRSALALNAVPSLRLPVVKQTVLTRCFVSSDFGDGFENAHAFVAAAEALMQDASPLFVRESPVEPAFDSALEVKPGSAQYETPTVEQAALLLVTLSTQTQSQPISVRATELLLRFNALRSLPEPTLYKIAKDSDSPLAHHAHDLRNERLLPIYERWLDEDEALNPILKDAVLTVAKAYPLHSAPTGFEEDKLAILCSFAGGVYPGMKADICIAAAEYLTQHVKRIPFFALWGLVLNLNDQPKRLRDVPAGPKVEDLDALQRLLEKGKVPDDIALPWEKTESGRKNRNSLAHLAVRELCARMLVERERLPRETAFLFLGRRANTLTSLVIATTIVPVVFPKLTPRQKLGLIGALAFAACVHVLMVPMLSRLEQWLLAHKALAGAGRSVGRLRDKLELKQHNAATRTRNALFSPEMSSPEVNLPKNS